MPVRYWMPNVSFLLPPCFPTLVIVGPALARNCPEFNVEIQKEKRIFQKNKKTGIEPKSSLWHIKVLPFNNISTKE